MSSRNIQSCMSHVILLLWTQGHIHQHRKEVRNMILIIKRAILSPSKDVKKAVSVIIGLVNTMIGKHL